MAQLEDYWSKVTSDPRFQALPDEKKEEARKRVFERMVGRSQKYLDAPETTKSAIRERFDQRIAIPTQKQKPGTLEQIEGTAKVALPKIVAPLEAAGRAVATGTREGIEGEKAVGEMAAKGMTLAKKGAQAAGDAGIEPFAMQNKVFGGARKAVGDVTRKVESAIAPSDSSVESAAKEKLSPDPKERMAGAIGQAGNVGRTILAGEAGTIGTAIQQAIPEDYVDVAFYATLPVIEKAAGRTFLGKSLSGHLPEFPPSPPGGTSGTVSMEEDLHNMVTKMLVEEKHQKPLEQIARSEETAKYEKWLQENDSTKPSDDRFDHFTEEMKVNHSQLRDQAQARLEYLKKEPIRLGELAREERMDRTKALPPGEKPKALLPERITRKGTAPRQKGYIPLGEADLPVGEIQTAPKGKPYALFIGNQDLGQGAVPYGTIYGEHENFRGTFPLEEIEKRGVPITGREPRVPEGMKPAPKDPKTKSFIELAKDISDGLGERGSVGPGDPVNPERADQLKANAKELIRRAKEAGMETTEDILKFAAAHYQAPGKNVFAEATKSTVNLSTVEEWPSKEAEAALKGNQVARASMRERAWNEFSKWKERREKSSLIVWKKAGDENTMALKAYFFRHDALFGLSDEERNALAFYIQGNTPNAEIFGQINPNAEKILELANNPSQKMIRAKEIIRPYEDEAFELLAKHSDKIQYKEDYVRQAWKNPDEVANWIEQRSGFSNPFEKHSEWANYAEGINAGHEPRTLDMNEILAHEDSLRIRTLSMFKVRGWLEQAKTIDGMPALMPESKAPASWERLDHPAFRDKVDGKTVRLAVSPDYKPLIKYLFQNKFLPYRVAAMFNALSKQGNLAFSLFHGQTLVLDQFVAGQPLKNLVGATKEFPWISPSKSSPYQMVAGIAKAIGKEMQPAPEGFEGLSSVKQLGNRMQRAYKAYMSGNPVLQNKALALDAAEHGVVFDSIPDLEFNLLSNSLRKIGKVASRMYPGLRTPFEMVAKGVDVQLKTIFTHLRNQGALLTYESQLADNLKAFPELPVDEVKNKTGQYVGKMFGGVAFTALMASPKMVQFLHLSMFAPDWLLTTWMREAKVATGAAKFMTGRKMAPDERQATFWMARLALGYAISGNTINYAMTNKYLGKGRFMWENEPGHELDIYGGHETDPKTGKPGRVRYIIPGRGFTDPYDAYMNPWKYMTGRVSPAARAAAAAITGYGPGGYPLQGKTPAGKLMEYGKRVAWPFSFTGQTAFFTYPVRKGMGYSQAKDMFLKSYKTGDAKYRSQAIQFGNENNLGGDSLERADTEARRQYHKDLIK